MRKALIALFVLVSACTGPSAQMDAGAPDMAIPLCASIQPPSDYPMGACLVGAICTHVPPEGWSCNCPAATTKWNCNYIGAGPDMAH